MTKVIDFNSEKEKVRKSDVDKTEDFLFKAMNDIAYGNLTIFEFTGKMNEFMKENDFSAKKFDKIQKLILKNHGIDLETAAGKQFIYDNVENMDIEDLEDTILAMNEDEPLLSKTPEQLKMEKETINRLAFLVHYEELVEDTNKDVLKLKNDKNDLTILLEDLRISIISEEKVDLSDDSLNEIIAAYKAISEKPLRVVICESVNAYDYL